MIRLLSGFKINSARLIGLGACAFFCLTWTLPCLGANGADKFHLSEAEKAWVAKHPVITLGIDRDFAPIERLDERNRYIGITADFLDLISEKTGLRFDIQADLTWEESIEAVKAGKIDMVGALVHSDQRAASLDFTHPYAGLSGAIIVREDVTEPMSLDKLKGMRVTVVHNYIWKDFLESKFPDLELNLAPDIETSLKKVSFGMTDAMVGYMATASHHIERLGISNLRVSGETVAVVDISFAVRKSMPGLTKLLNRVLSSTTEAQRDEIRRKWIRLEFMAPTDLLYLRRILFFVLGTGILVVTGIMLWNRSLRREVSHRTEELNTELVERRRMELALRESEEKYRSIFDNIQDIYYEISPDGEILEISPSIEKVFHLTRKKMIGKSLSDYYLSPDGPGPVIEKIIEKGRLPDHEILLAGVDGEPAICSMNAMLVRGDKGEPLKIIGSIRNITTRVKAQQELKKAYHELEKRVEERTAELRRTNRALKRAKETADAATRTKSDFLANMSHEIRTPMNGVIAASELVMNEPLSPRMAHYMEIINTSGRSLLEVIDDILDFSKIEAGKLDLELRPFDLDRLMARIIHIFNHKMAEKQIRFMVHLDHDVPPNLVGDSVRIQQILTNLVSNAVKFTDENGKILIRVKAMEQGEDDPLMLEFSVNDTGIGIAPAHQHLLFTPFSQIDASTTRKFGGSGLGLSICGQLVEMMGGSIRVDSSPGRGSAFTFTVPLEPPEKPSRTFDFPKEFKELRLLVVDEDKEAGEILAGLVNAMGGRALTAGSCTETLDIVREAKRTGTPFGMIVMDLELPDMAGLVTVRKIREAAGIEVPVLMTVTSAGDASETRLVDYGVNDYLTKPVTRDSFQMALKVLVGKEGGADEPSGGDAAKALRDSLSGKKILVAEDNPTNQDITLAVLSNAGIIARVVDDGRKAVEAVQKSFYDVVLMDIQMPELDGFEATRAIRKIPALFDLPIIAMTAHTLKGAEERCRAAGMNGYISKPVSQEKLFQAILGVLNPREETEQEALFPLPHVNSGAPSELPSALPGIRIRKAMELLDIGDKTYLKILGRFFRDNGDFTQNLLTEWKAGEPSPVLNRLHNLKGSSAGIGAADLHRLVKELEEFCRHGETLPPAGSDPVELLDRELEKVLGSIRTLIEALPPGEAPAKPSDFDPGKAAETLDRLEEALDLSALQAIEAHFSALETVFDHPELQVLKEQIAAYDYEPALETIKTIRSLLETERP